MLVEIASYGLEIIRLKAKLQRKLSYLTAKNMPSKWDILRNCEGNVISWIRGLITHIVLSMLNCWFCQTRGRSPQIIRGVLNKKNLSCKVEIRQYKMPHLKGRWKFTTYLFWCQFSFSWRYIWFPHSWCEGATPRYKWTQHKT